MVTLLTTNQTGLASRPLTFNSRLSTGFHLDAKPKATTNQITRKWELSQGSCSVTFQGIIEILFLRE